jgi:hypothetical protein
VTKLLHGFFSIRDMLVLRDLCGKSGGAALSSNLDRGREYAERTQRLSDERLSACRAVLILIEVLVLLMPLMEHLCRWDKFLQGGPDVEFGILCLLLFAGLVLLTAHRAVTSPFLVLLAYRLIALPVRCLSMPRQSSLSLSSFHERRREASTLAFSSLSGTLTGTPLRI